MAAQFNGKNETEILLCDIIVVLKFLHYCVSESFMWKVLGLNTNLTLDGKWLTSLPVVRRASSACFCHLFVHLRACHVLQWSYKLSVPHFFCIEVDEALNKVVTNSLPKILLKAVFNKEFCRKVWKLQGHKASSF